MLLNVDACALSDPQDKEHVGFSILFGKCETALELLRELCCVMLVQQIQSHCGDTSPATELGLTAAGQTETAVFLSSSKDAERNREKGSCETRK